MLGRLKMVLLGAPDDVRGGVLSLPIAIESLLPLIGIKPGGGGFAELASATIDGVLPIDADGRTGTGTTELSRRARFAVGMSALGGGGGLGSGEGGVASEAAPGEGLQTHASGQMVGKVPKSSQCSVLPPPIPPSPPSLDPSWLI